MARSPGRLIVLHDRPSIPALEGVECVSSLGCPRDHVVDLATNASGRNTAAFPSCLRGRDVFINLSLGGPSLPALGHLLGTSDRPGAGSDPSGLDLLCDLAATFTPTRSMICFREPDDRAGGTYSILAGRLPASTDSAYNALIPLPDHQLSALLDALPSWLGCIDPANLRIERRGIAPEPIA